MSNRRVGQKKHTQHEPEEQQSMILEFQTLLTIVS